MPKSFLGYLRPQQISSAISDGLLDHAASEQFGRAASGDVLWITGKTVKEPLVTVGPLRVAEIVSQREAKRRLPYDPWPARYHALSAPRDATVTREVSLGSILGELEFVSSSRRLNPKKRLGQQLQTMRELAPESAEKIRQLWDGAAKAAISEFEEIQRRLDSYDDLDHEQVVLARREQSFLRQYLFKHHESSICAVCGRELPVSLLVAAHIKPRAKCSEKEKRDYANNVIPMCLLGCDALFERGLVVVEDGKVVVRMRSTSNDELNRILDSLAGFSTHAWKVGRIRYFSWHARHRRELVK